MYSLKTLSIYSVKKYSKEDKKEWDHFLVNSKNATFLFQRDFMEYHKDRFEDYSLLIFKNDSLIALLPANIKEQKLYSHEGLTFGGILFEATIKFNEVYFVFVALLKYLEKQNITELIIKRMPRFYTSHSTDDLDYLLFKAQAKVFRKDISSVVDSTNKVKKVSSIRKRGIKKALKNNLEIREEDRLNEFWDYILIPNLAASHNARPVHTSKEIQQLKNIFPENIKQFNVYYNDKIVGGTTIFETDNVAHSQYISANLEGKQLGALDFLFNYLMNEKYLDKKYFDFGTSNENQGQQINEGLLIWKESFGAEFYVHEFYAVETKNHDLLNDLFL